MTAECINCIITTTQPKTESEVEDTPEGEKKKKLTKEERRRGKSWEWCGWEIVSLCKKYEGQNQTVSHKRDFWFHCEKLWRLWFMCRVYAAPWHHLSGIHFSAGSCWGDCYFAQRRDYWRFPNPFSPINYSNLTEPHYAWNLFFFFFSQLSEWSSACVSMYTRGCLHSPRVVQCWVIGGWELSHHLYVWVSEYCKEFFLIYFPCLGCFLTSIHPPQKIFWIFQIIHCSDFKT